MFSPAEDMSGRIEADTSSSTLEEEFPPDLLEKTRGDKERQEKKKHQSINAENNRKRKDFNWPISAEETWRQVFPFVAFHEFICTY